MMVDINKAMEDVAELNKTSGIKMRGGATYTKVAQRLEVFRKHFGLDYGIETEVQEIAGGVLVKATISHSDSDGTYTDLSTGHAYSKNLSADKGFEKLETTAIGRALASLGLAGGEFATVDEVESSEERYSQPQPQKPKPLEQWEYDELGQALQSAESLDDLKQQWTKAYNAKHRMTDDQFGFLVKVKDERKGQLQTQEASE